jgi:hypothetical protein
MRQQLVLPSCALMFAVIFSVLAATAQNAAPVSLQEQLIAQYNVAKMGSDSSGTTVVEPGTLLAIQKGGVLAVPWKALAVCPAKYQDGSLHSPGLVCSSMVKSVSRYFQNGDKVYPIKIDVNLEKQKISFSLVACDSCNGVNPPTSFKGEVVFQFPAGYLEKASAAEVEDTIGQVLSVSGGEETQQRQTAQVGQEQQPPSQPQPEPRTIQLGQTISEVQGALGQPEKIVDLGAKQIYVYKDLKITFVNGKVSDVQ